MLVTLVLVFVTFFISLDKSFARENKRANKSIKKIDSENELDNKSSKIDSSASLTKDELEEVKNYISYMEAVLKKNSVGFSKKAIQKDGIVEDELNQKLDDLKSKVKAKEEEVESEKLKSTYLTWTIAGMFLFLIPSILSIIMFRNNNKTKKKNSLLDQKNNDISQAYLNIKSSIEYAKRIQNSVLSKPEILTSYVEDSFIYYKPKDIVSGDFYWFSQVENKLIVAVVDCTGHGVSGAFMTMMGISFFNEIVNESKVTKPEKILLELESKLEAIVNTRKKTATRDGMKVSLVVLDKEKGEFSFAGAKSECHIIENNKLKTIKGSLRGVGGFSKNKKISFTTTSIDLSKVKSFYIFSNGYYDQFDTEKSKRITKKGFKKLLLDNHKKSLADQKSILESEMKKWMGESSQIDDMLILGVKI